MSEVVRLTPADARRVPWRNGRGVTEELALWPPGALFERGDFDARISKASVDEPGPFSAFPGFDRVLVATSGEGLLLDHGCDAGLVAGGSREHGRAPPARVERLVPYAFSGDWTTSARLLGGPVTDFNVIVRRGRLRAGVRVLELADGETVREHLASGDAFVHVLRGGVLAHVSGAGTPVALAAGDSLWIRESTPAGPLVLARAGGDPSGDCVALHVSIGAA